MIVEDLIKHLRVNVRDLNKRQRLKATIFELERLSLGTEVVALDKDVLDLNTDDITILGLKGDKLVIKF